VAGALVAALPSGILIALAIFPWAIARASGSLGDGLAVAVLGENRGRYGQIRATGSLA
jgi:hypothetical protein